MQSRWSGVFLLCTFLYGPETSAAQSGVQQLKGVKGGRFTFPIDIPNLRPESDVIWKHGSENPEWSIARIHGGKIEAVYEDRFKSRLQVDSSGSLQINNLESEDAGFYQVDVAPGVSFKRMFYLSVYKTVSAPEVKRFNESGKLFIRACVLQCSVENDKDVSLYWLRDGLVLNQLSSPREKTLELLQETQGDDVNYTCVASNSVSNQTISVTPFEYCPESKLHTELILRVLVFIVLTGVVIAVCVWVWKKGSAQDEDRLNRLFVQPVFIAQSFKPCWD